jgi:hypothetical protein
MPVLSMPLAWVDRRGDTVSLTSTFLNVDAHRMKRELDHPILVPMAELCCV